MKVSVNWLKEFVDIDVPVDELAGKIGAQLGEVEEVVHLGQKYQGALIAKVVERKDHPNADRLSLCKIDVGRSRGSVQVVCGAPNVREGMLVVWLPPGTTVPRTHDKDPFVLESREVRGEMSNGMLASPHELDISDDHAGIMEVEAEAKPGTEFAKAYGLDDYVIEIENKMFTHRPDCFGLLGVAREIAGIFGKQFKSPDWYLQARNKEQGASSKELPLEVLNDLPKLAPRFMAVAVSNVSVRPSTFYHQAYLSRVGIKPINNVVDLTNYMMYLTGQPMHAYDYDKVLAKQEPVVSSKQKVARMVIRHPKKGEKLKVLGGKVITPKSDDIMIATDKELIGFGGVIGGADTEVDDNTTNIIFECANFDLYAVRKTSMAHGLFTDAVTRFSKGQSPSQTDKVLAKALELMVDGPAKQASNVIDDNYPKASRKPLSVDAGFINKRLGSQLTGTEIAKLLNNVEFDAKLNRNSYADGSQGEDEERSESYKQYGERAPKSSTQRATASDSRVSSSARKLAGTIRVSVPFWRTDIEIAEDIVEEVGRLYGYDRLPLDLPDRKMSPAVVSEELQTKSSIRGKLSALGANELLNYSFVHGDLLAKSGQDTKLAYSIKNALSPDLQYYRLSLTPNLLERVHPNLKAGYGQFALFEIGKVHGKSEADEAGLPKELGRAGLVVAAGKKSKLRADYFLAKHYLEQLYPRGREITYQPIAGSILAKHKMASQMLAPYEPNRSAVVFVGGKVAGVVGEYKQTIKDALKLPKHTAGFEIFLSSLAGKSASGYKPISKYPHTEQDISLRTDAKLTHGQIKSALDEALEKYAPQDVSLETRCIDIFQKETSHKQTAFRVRAISHERTLSTKIVSLVLDKTADELAKTIKAERV